MAIKEKIKTAFDKIKVIMIENKKLVIASVTTLALTTVLALNINLIQMTFYKMNDQTQEIINLLDKKVLNIENQNDLYFKMGMDYILEILGEEEQRFIDDHFTRLSQEVQVEVIDMYNIKNLFLHSNQEVLKVVSKGDAAIPYRRYVGRIDREKFEKDLNKLFGEDLKVTQDTATSLYNILKLRSDKLSMEHFEISIYQLMSFPHQGDQESIAIKLLGYIEPESAREKLFSELKMQPIELEQLYLWVDVLNKKGVVGREEYAGFMKNYNEIKRIREENKSILVQEVDLLNVKETIDLKTSELTTQVEKEQKEVTNLDSKKSELQKQLAQHKNYKTLDVYILDQYENGEYEGAIPEKSWLLGIYKPGDDKLRIKVTGTAINNLGVYTFEAYSQGVDDKGLPYYVEVSPADKEKMRKIENEIASYEKQLAEKRQIIDGAKQEIDQIRKANNYEQTIDLLKGIEDKKRQLEVELKTYQLEMQSLFGIGNIIITL